MSDSDFKNLQHHSEGFMKFSDGKEIEKHYSPDYSLNKGDEYILIEHESEPNRKTILADMIKAAHFLQGKRNGVLLIVMTPKRKSSLDSYPKHIDKYFKWIKGKTNLKRVNFIDESKYYHSNVVMEIGTQIFNDECLSIP